MRNGLPMACKSLLLVVAGALAACSHSAPSRFYTLAPLASPEAKPPSNEAASRLSINVEPVEVPDYLERPQIVTREGGNEVKLAEFHRWAGSLGENISTVLAENLALLVGTDRVLVDNGAPLQKPDYTVAMRLLRLDCLPGDHVLLKAQWRVFAADGRKGSARLSTITERVSDSRYNTMVAAVNRAVDKVSREIAAEIPLQGAAAAPSAGAAGARRAAPNQTKGEPTR